MSDLSQHFTLEEMTASQEATRKGIDNRPSALIVSRLTETCRQLEAVRTLLGAPMIVSSGYRSPALNAALGGVPNSAHCAGDAVDFICPSVGTPLEICMKIAAARIKLDQCIQEGTWVHVSFAPTYRQQFLTATFDATGKAKYSDGLNV